MSTATVSSYYTTAVGETKKLKKYFSLNTWQFLILLGIAVSGLAAYVNTYNDLSGISDDVEACQESDELQDKYKTQMIVTYVLASLAIIIGMVLAWLWRDNQNPRKLVTMGIITAGLFGIGYGLTISFRNTTNKIKIVMSWLSFVAFIILGFLFSTERISYNPGNFGYNFNFGSSPQSIELQTK